MPQDAIDRVLRERQPRMAEAAKEEGKFFSVLNADGLNEHYLELQFRNGVRSCFNYSDLQWFSWDPQGFLDLEFGGFTIIIKGRGLYEGLFHGIKNKRVAWVKESDSEMQDHDGNDAFVESIEIIPPEEFGEQAEAP